MAIIEWIAKREGVKTRQLVGYYSIDVTDDRLPVRIHIIMGPIQHISTPLPYVDITIDGTVMKWKTCS